MSKRNLIICALIVALGLIIIVDATKSDAKDEKSTAHWQSVREGMKLNTTFNEINVSADVFSIYLEPSADEHTYIQIKNSPYKELEKHFKLDIKESRDQLDITVEGKKKSFSILDIDEFKLAELWIQLPAHEYEKIKLNNDVGKINYNRIYAEQLEVKNSVGEIVIQDTEAGRMKIKNEVGSIKMNVKSITNDLDAETEVGTINIEVAREPDNIAIDLETELGSITTNLEADYDSQTKRKVKAQKGSNGPTVAASSSIGSIKVDFKK